MRRVLVMGLCAGFASTAAGADGDAGRGQQLFSRACAACHLLKPDTNMTGPSLAGLFGRKAGSLASFSRYSPAMKATHHIWQTMDYWERNLRFKTDTSEIGPLRNAPAIVGAGMAGDRASVIFSMPEEISAWIKSSC